MLSFLHEIDTHFFDPNPDWPSDDQNKGTVIGLQVQGDVLVGNHRMMIGGNFLHDQSDGTSVGKHTRDSYAVFEQNEFIARDIFGLANTSVTVLPSLRYDFYSDFGGVISPKIGILLTKHGRERIALRANIGRSFRAPTFNELYWPEDFFSKGNPDLVPERVINMETGAVFGLNVAGDITGEINYFTKLAEDLIQWNFDPVTYLSTPENIQKAKIVGQEISLKWHPKIKGTVVEFKYTHLEALNKTAAAFYNKTIKYRPEHTANLLLGGTAGPVGLNTTLYYVSSRFIDEANTTRLPDFLTVDINAGLTYSLFNLNWQLRFEVDNIFDKSYILMNQYPMPGRLWRISMGMNL